MHRIDGPGATAQNTFTEGSPTGGVPATVVTDDWLNDVQENIAKAIENAGITLAKGNYQQLTQAISALALLALPKRSFLQNDFIRVPNISGGLILQFGLVQNIAPASFVDVPLPTTFPSTFRGLVVSHGSSNVNRTAPLGGAITDNSSIRVANSDNQVASAYFFAWGN